MFAGRHFDREVILLCIRWCLRYKVSFRDLVEMMAECWLSLAHTTILRWVGRYASEFVKRRNRFGRSCGRSWRVDETYSKVRGKWVYLYRAAREMRSGGLLPKRTKLRSSKYQDNLIEQDHRGIRSRTRPMHGFKNFESAAITITAIELLRRIHKGQFTLRLLRSKNQAAPAFCNAVLAA